MEQLRAEVVSNNGQCGPHFLPAKLIGGLAGQFRNLNR
jgi:hypothetical protein